MSVIEELFLRIKSLQVHRISGHVCLFVCCHAAVLKNKITKSSSVSVDMFQLFWIGACHSPKRSKLKTPVFFLSHHSPTEPFAIPASCVKL